MIKVKSKEVTFSSKDAVKIILSDGEEEDDDDDKQDDDNEDDEETIVDDHKRPFLSNGFTGRNQVNGQISTGSSIGLSSIGRIKILKPKKNRRNHQPYRWLCYLVFVVIISLLIYFVYSEKTFIFQELKQFTTLYQGKSCSSLNSDILWNSTLPLLTITSSLQLVDINQDGNLDIIAAFGTEADFDDDKYQSILCTIYFNITYTEAEQVGCGGGLIAVDGKRGTKLWLKFVRHKITSLNCLMDINDDQILDCVGGGAVGSIYAFDASNGDIIWSFLDMDLQVINSGCTFSKPLYLSRDYDNDNIQDMILIHGEPLYLSSYYGDNQVNRKASKMILASSKTGKILTWTNLPAINSVHLNPQKLITSDANELILFTSNTPNSSSSIYITLVDNIFHDKNLQTQSIYTICCGINFLQPILVDINEDNYLDIILATSNGSIITIDGNSFDLIWRKDFTGNHIQSEPGIAFFNDDKIVDVFVMYKNSNSTEVTVLDGKSGQSSIHPVTMMFATKSSPLTISTYGKGDLILFWLSTCGNFDGINQSFNGLKPLTEINARKKQSLINSCSTRFKSSSYVQLMALSRYNYSIIYDSRRHRNVQMKNIKSYAEMKKNLQQVEDKLLMDNNVPYSDYVNRNQVDYNQQDYDQSVFDYANFLDNNDNIIGRENDDQENGVKIGRNLPRSVDTSKSLERQLIMSTGTLAPSHVSGCVDVIFAVEWLSTSTKEFDNNNNNNNNGAVDDDKPDFKFNEMQNCINGYIRLLNDYEQEEEAKMQLIKDKCFKLNDFKIPLMGTSIHRKRLKCLNNLTLIRPHKEQLWPSYMGLFADGIANIVKY